MAQAVVWRLWPRGEVGIGARRDLLALAGTFGELAAMGRGMAEIISALGDHIVANFSHSVESAG